MTDAPDPNAASTILREIAQQFDDETAVFRTLLETSQDVLRYLDNGVVPLSIHLDPFREAVKKASGA